MSLSINEMYRLCGFKPTSGNHLCRIVFYFITMNLCNAALFSQIERYSDVDITIPEVALMDIEPNTGSITLSVNAPTEAGSPPSGSSNTSKWINYTSAIAPTTSSRSIQAEISNGSVPSGLVLRVEPSADAGGGGGSMGSSAGTVTLSGSPRNIITGIQGCYTGNGSGNGHRLRYTLRITDYGQLNNSDSGGTVEITFTIIDN